VNEGWRAHRFAPKPGTKLCTLADVPDGDGRALLFGDAKNGFGVVVFRVGDRAIAYHNACPHFGLPLNVSERFIIYAGRVYCANHSAMFRIDDGFCEEGPCKGDALTPLPVDCAGGMVVLAEDP